MIFKIYNTLTGQKEIFSPLVSQQATIYSCGVTVYDRCHLGHARGVVNFDVLRNLLKALGYQVTFVRNYTDIDDKIIQRAHERNCSPQELANQMIIAHDDDMRSLGIQPPDISPRATEHIPSMINLIEKLIEKKQAYVVDGDVFFSVRTFADYGKLSGKKIEDLEAGARVEINHQKKDVLDFALWKKAKPNEPYWESPWGLGRPGWHIECSAMSTQYLGETFDIHVGGSDLIFPHHENEIAQSEACYERPFARYWMHNGMIKINNQKMSKSLGNFATIHDLVKKYHPELLRFFILSSHYRHALDFNEQGLMQSAEALDRIYTAMQKEPNNLIVENFDPTAQTLQQRFLAALCDDLNTPQAIGILFEITKALNLSQNSSETAQYISLLKTCGQLLGILQIPVDEWFKAPRIQKDASETISEDEIEKLIAQRNHARKNRNWQEADQIRDQLAEMSIILKDQGEHTTWVKK